jgi:hypothetical protein
VIAQPAITRLSYDPAFALSTSSFLKLKHVLELPMSRVAPVAAIAACLFLGSVGVASAQQSPLVAAGTLECKGGPSVGFVVGSETNLTCLYHRPRHRRPVAYVATVHRAGVDLGVTNTWALAWDVMTPTGRVPRGGLAGSYGGAGSSISIGGGAASNAVVGGPGNSVSLQPRPVDGVTGLALAFGFQGMDIKPGR